MQSPDLESELEIFRKKWRKEVQQQHQQKQQQEQSKVFTDNGGNSITERPAQSSSLNLSKISPTIVPVSLHSPDHISLDLEKLSLAPSSPPLSTTPHSKESHSKTAAAATEIYSEDSEALKLYKKAVEYERCENLGKALEFYRKAFKLDPQVDIEVYSAHKNQPTTAATYLEDHTPSSDSLLNEQPVEAVSGRLHLHAPGGGGTLSKLPNEVIIEVLKWVVLGLEGVKWLTRYAQCSKWCFDMVLQSSFIWQTVCRYYWQDRFNLERGGEKLLREVKARQGWLDRCSKSWRLAWLSRPRIRWDGCYISTCYYLRPGLSENNFDQPIHLVTYYRYLRFFPNGRCCSLQSTLEPPKVVRGFHPDSLTQAHPEAMLGYYEWENPEETSLNHSEIHLWLYKPEKPHLQFQVRLQVVDGAKNKNMLRWSRLAWQEYFCYDERRGESCHFDLQGFKSFYFSKVRTYTV